MPQDDRPDSQQHTEGNGQEHELLDTGDAAPDTEGGCESEAAESPAGGAQAPSGDRDQKGEDPDCQTDADVHRNTVWLRSWNPA